jgi:hypothetical protein
MSTTFTFSYNIPEKSIGGFVIDVFREEKYNFTADVTDIPIEEGDTASDHVVNRPCEIRISAFIGNAEFVVFDTPQQTGDPKERIRAAYYELLRLKNEGQPLTLVTGLASFPNMVIVSFEISRDVETGSDLPFDMTFKEIRVTKSEVVGINVKPNLSSSDQVTPAANYGVAATKKVDDLSSMPKEIWRTMFRNSGGELPTREEFHEKWGAYP